MKRTSRKPSTLSESLQRHLNSYALAASAAGVGVLALAQTADARIIYKPVHRPVSLKHPVEFEFGPNAHFTISLTSLSSTRFASQTSLHADGIGQVAGFYTGFSWSNTLIAYALGRGQQIGGNLQFEGRVMATRQRYRGKSVGTCSGPWNNVKDRFLGLKFSIAGQKRKHYGWARLNASCDLKRHKSLRAVLTGYAYETIANKSIIAGKTKGPDVITLEPDSLGALAAGASRLHRGSN